MNEFDDPGAGSTQIYEQCFVPGCLYPNSPCYAKELKTEGVNPNTSLNILTAARAIDANGGVCPDGYEFTTEEIEAARQAVPDSDINDDDINWP